MSDTPSPEIDPAGPDTPAEPAAPPATEPAPYPEIAPPATPIEAPPSSPVPDDGRPYD